MAYGHAASRPGRSRAAQPVVEQWASPAPSAAAARSRCSPMVKVFASAFQKNCVLEQPGVVVAGPTQFMLVRCRSAPPGAARPSRCRAAGRARRRRRGGRTARRRRTAELVVEPVVRRSATRWRRGTAGAATCAPRLEWPTSCASSSGTSEARPAARRASVRGAAGGTARTSRPRRQSDCVSRSSSSVFCQASSGFCALLVDSVEQAEMVVLDDAGPSGRGLRPGARRRVGKICRSARR